MARELFSQLETLNNTFKGILQHMRRIRSDNEVSGWIHEAFEAQIITPQKKSLVGKDVLETPKLYLL